MTEIPWLCSPPTVISLSFRCYRTSQLTHTTPYHEITSWSQLVVNYIPRGPVFPTSKLHIVELFNAPFIMGAKICYNFNDALIFCNMWLLVSSLIHFLLSNLFACLLYLKRLTRKLLWTNLRLYNYTFKVKAYVNMFLCFKQLLEDEDETVVEVVCIFRLEAL
jgi:hypothetical protein